MRWLYYLIMKKHIIPLVVAVAISPQWVVQQASAGEIKPSDKASHAGFDHILYFNHPTSNWEREGLPIGNGSLGGVVLGGPDKLKMQFNVDSLWTGNENKKGGYNKTGKGDVFGAYQNFGWLIFDQSGQNPKQAEGYRNQLDISNALVTTTWKSGGVTYTREALASHPDQVIVWRISADQPGKISGVFHLKGAHPQSKKAKEKSLEKESLSVAETTLTLKGVLANGLKYQAQAQVVSRGGSIKSHKDSIEVSHADELLVFLAADTNYVMNRADGWMKGDPADKVIPRLKKATGKKWSDLLKNHISDYQSFYNRVSINIGKSDAKLASKPINERIDLYRKKANIDPPRPCLDPELEAMLFNYGRYLLISSSREGTLPANLQGIWNNSNTPAWSADYHTNINVQMCYWLAETTNLPELAKPLFDMFSAQIPVFKEHSQKYYKVNKGFVTRMSVNPFGGGGWNWNIEGSAWLSQHFWEHYQFSLDREFLKNTAWPWMSEVSEFWLARLKTLPDGSLVVPDAWSHEHGPHEDGTAHGQQLMWDLFTSTLKAAKILKTNPDLQKRLTLALEKLYGPKVGSWGQLMEWMTEKPDLEKGHHRHTSHLYAVFPGSQITMKQPKLMQAAIVSLTKRGEVGDSRRSWTWAWRTALWARMGKAERAHGCVAGMLAYNTLPNLWTTHPPFQIDGNMGIPAGMAEMFVQSHTGEIQILPALPKVYPTGSIQGLRARGDVIVSIWWKNGKFTRASFVSKHAQTIKVRIPGESSVRSVKLSPGKPVEITTK